MNLPEMELSKWARMLYVPSERPAMSEWGADGVAETTASFNGEVVVLVQGSPLKAARTKPSARAAFPPDM